MIGDVASSDQDRGAGRLVLVVGPSGAGKDTLIDLVRKACASEPTIIFPQRVVTREASIHEANISVSPAGFEQALARGEFVLHWHAHGLGYGLSRSILDEVARGQVVVVNASRTVIAAARRLFRQVTVVQVTAPPEVLATRLAARGRDSDGRLDQRLQRSDGLAGFDADVTINNTGPVETHARELLAAVLGVRAVLPDGEGRGEEDEAPCPS